MMAVRWGTLTSVAYLCTLLSLYGLFRSVQTVDTTRFNPDDCPSGTQADTVYEICTRCAIGYYREKGVQERCEKCPQGYITQEIGAGRITDCDVPVGLRDSCVSGYEWASSLESCRPCPLGSYRTQGVQYWCVKCPDSTNTNHEGATTVAACLTGQESCQDGTAYNDTTHSCEPCPKGTYRKKDQSDICLSCPANHITAFIGSVSPMDCVAFSDDDQIFTQEKCPAGTEYDIRLMTCRRCPVNTYRRQNDGMTCRPCPDNKVTLRPGATHEVVCIATALLATISHDFTEDQIPVCPLGTEWSDEHMSCSLCTVGTYRDDLSMALCQQCPAVQQTPTQGAKNKAACGASNTQSNYTYVMGTCVSGTSWNSVLQSCSLCPFGTFSPNGEECVVCSNGRMTSSRGASTPDACVLPQIPDYQMPYFTPDSCPSGSEWDAVNEGCQPCPRGTYRLVSPSEGEPRQCQPCMDGHTTLTPGSIYGFMCVIPTRGPETLPIGSDGCPPGYEINTTVCTVCPKGYYKSSMGWDMCAACPIGFDEVHRGTLDRGSTDVNDCIPAVSINKIDPEFGPQSGGTVITLDVKTDRPVRIISIMFDEVDADCQPLSLYLTDGRVQCLTSAVRNLPAGGRLTVQASHGVTVTSRTSFNFKANPIIDGVNRMKSIKSGGQNFIVYGRNMDSVAVPVLMLRPTSFASQYSSMQLPCKGEGPSAIMCCLPALPASTRRRRETNDNKNPLVEFDVGLQLDGVHNYSKLQDIYPQYGTLKFYEDPEVFSFRDNGELVIPSNEATITFYGERLDLASSSGDYKVLLGKCHAAVLSLAFDDMVVQLCPDMTANEDHKVLVEVGSLSFNVGILRLEPSSKSDKSRRVLLPVLLVLLFSLAIIFVVVVCMCMSQREQRKRRDTAIQPNPGTSTLSRPRSSKNDADTLPPLPVESVFGPERVTDRGHGMRKLALPENGTGVELEPGEKTDLMRYRIVGQSYYNTSVPAPKEAWGETLT